MVVVVEKETKDKTAKAAVAAVHRNRRRMTD